MRTTGQHKLTRPERHDRPAHRPGLGGLVWSAALSAAALLASACSSGIGPLGGPGSPGSECFPAAKGRTVTDGIDALQNSGKIPATVQKVTLTNPHGVAMTTRAWLVPIWHTQGDYDVIGDGFPYPPVTWGTWKHRRLAVGGVIRPGQSLNLVFGIKRTARTGRSGPTTIVYTAGCSTYTLTESTSTVMNHGNC
jgi:hypothetical protein